MVRDNPPMNFESGKIVIIKCSRVETSCAQLKLKLPAMIAPSSAFLRSIGDEKKNLN